MEDRNLIELVLSGDREAFSPLMDRYYAMVYRLCLNMTGNVPDAEELAHDSFVEAYLKLGQLREPERFGGWLKVLTLNLCRMWYRRNQNRPVELDDEHAVVQEDEVDDGLVRARMSYGLSTLPAPHRLILVLHYYEELSYDEIATFLEIPKGTVMSRLHRARQALKEVMEQMTEHEDIPAVPDERFKEVVQAEIAVLLKMFQDEPNATERLALVLKKSPERLMGLVTDAESEEILNNLAILLSHLGSDAVDEVLDRRFSKNETARENAAKLLRSYAERCGIVEQRAGMDPMSSRDAYMLVERIIEHPADDNSKVELLFEMMESAKNGTVSLLFTNALVCYGEAAFALLMDRFRNESGGSRVLHAVVRFGRRFAEESVRMLESEKVGELLLGLTGCEAIARSLDHDYTSEHLTNRVRIEEKYPPLYLDEVGENVIERMKQEAAVLASNSNTEVRDRAIRLLGHFKAKEYAETIKPCMSNPVLSTRLAAIYALWEMGDSDSTDAFIDRAVSGEPSERIAAIKALGHMQATQAEEHLIRMVNDPIRQVREAAITALGEMKTDRSQAVLQNLLTSTDNSTRKIVAKALFGGTPPRKIITYSNILERLADKVKKRQPITTISPDACMRFGGFEAKSYEERDLTERFAKICSDYCATRRYMIELGLLTRSNGIYQFTRSGETALRVEKFIYEKYLSRA